MGAENADEDLIRFDRYELDIRSGELRKDGRTIKLGPQPFKVLALLASRTGEVVTRAEIQRELWPDDTFVDFELGINSCIKQVRSALGDNKDDPRFIETLPRHGYRFALETDARASAHSVRRSTGNRWIAVALTGGAAAAGGFLVAGLMTNPSAAVPRVENPVQVTSGAGVENYPTWSPDAGRIAYQSDQSGNLDIWVAQLKGGRAANRTADHAGFDREPAWSPDGSQIAFASGRDGAGIYLMPAIGGISQKISPTASEDARYRSPQWSSDGTELAYLVREDQQTIIEIVSLSTRESNRYLIPGGTGGRWDLSWSSDGRLFAYVRAAGVGVSRLWVLRVSDGQVFAVTDGTSSDWSPMWSRDARKLYFLTSRRGMMDLWQKPIAADGRPEGEEVPVTVGLGMQQAALSPDGRKLAYSRGRPVANVWRVPILKDREAVWADAEQLTFDQAYNRFVDLSPDGEQLLVGSDRGGTPDIWLLPIRGGDMRQLTTDRAWDAAPRWSPDGQLFAFMSNRRGNWDIWIMSLDGGPAVPLTQHERFDMIPTWSPDGRDIAFYSGRTGATNVFVVPAAGGEPQAVTEESSIDTWPQWSPDGRWLTFHSNREDGVGRLWRVPSSGGTPERLTEGRTDYFRWSPDGKHIYFKRGEKDLWSFTVENGIERRVTNFSQQPGNLGLAGLAVGEGYLYFIWETVVGDIWVVDFVTDENR